MKKRNPRAPKTSILPIIAALILSTAIRLCGFIIRIGDMESFVCACVCFAILAVMTVFSFVLGIRMRRKLEAMRFTDRKDILRDMMDKAEKDLNWIDKKLLSNIAFVWGWIAIGILLNTMMIFFSSALEKFNTASSFFFCLGIILNWGFIVFIFPRKKENKPKIADRDKFPIIYSTVDSVFGNNRRQTIICPDGSSTVGVAFENGRVIINLGVKAAGILTQKELYQALLHEKAHVHHDFGMVSVLAAKLSAKNRLSAESVALSITDWFVMMPMVKFSILNSLIELTASRAREVRADKYAELVGDAKIAADMNAKLKMCRLYFDREYCGNVLAEDTPPQNEFTRQIKLFRQAFPKRETFWRGIIENSLPSFVDTHPTFAQRWETLGKPDYSIVFDDPSLPYMKEREDFVKLCDELLFNKLKDDFESLKKQEYLPNIVIAQDYEYACKNGIEYPVTELRTVIDAYCYLDRYEDMLAVCEANIARAKTPSESAHAFYMRGVHRLRCYDKSGIEDVYLAMDTNNNYIADGLGIVGEFCVLMGLEKELKGYRERTAVSAQTQIDIQNAGIDITVKSKLSEETALPQKDREENLNFILDVCGADLDKVYLVRHEITAEYICSCYALSFTAGTTDTKIEEYWGKIFRYLDSLEWDYFLFMLTEEKELILNRVPNTLIYEKEI